MADMKIKGSGFDPDVGIMPLPGGGREIGRANLPLSTELLPEAEGWDRASVWLFGRLSDSAMTDRLRRWLAPRLLRRELLTPEVFFGELAAAAAGFGLAAAKLDGKEKENLAAAEAALLRILEDRTLCETLRNLVLQT